MDKGPVDHGWECIEIPDFTVDGPSVRIKHDPWDYEYEYALLSPCDGTQMNTVTKKNSSLNGRRYSGFLGMCSRDGSLQVLKLRCQIARKLRDVLFRFCARLAFYFHPTNCLGRGYVFV